MVQEDVFNEIRDLIILSCNNLGGGRKINKIFMESNFINDIFVNISWIKEKYETATELPTSIVSWLNHGFIVLPDDKEYEKLRE